MEEGDIMSEYSIPWYLTEEHKDYVKSEKAYGYSCIHLYKDWNLRTRKIYHMDLFPKMHLMQLLITGTGDDSDTIYKHVKINNTKKWHSK